MPSRPPDGQAEIAVELACEPQAPAAARVAVLELRERLPDEKLEDLELLTSELVTNSVRHAAADPASTIELKVTVSPARVRVQVSDRGQGFEPPEAPPPSGEERGYGWGLFLVERIADRWGVAQGESTCVWYELDL